MVSLKPGTNINSLPKDRSGLAIVVLQCLDGACTHAVCVTDELIFDSNEDYALPLKQEYLDQCVRSASTKFPFTRVASGLLLHKKKGKKRKMHKAVV